MIVRDKDMGMRRLFKDLKSLKGSYTKVGFQQGENREDASSMVKVAAAQEYGTEDIPERSFLRSTHDENRGRYHRLMSDGASQILTGARGPKEVLGAIGDIAQMDIQAKIRSDLPPPLAEATLENRRRRKKPSTKALIDTAQMIGAVRHVEHIRGGA